jgi:hypothetical protein
LNAITNDLWFRHGCGLIFGLQPKINNVMKQIFTFSLAVVTALALFTGCKKEGCNDPDATNYNADAGKDDGSCLFEIANNCPADISGDGLINTSDLLNALQNGVPPENSIWKVNPFVRPVEEIKN